MIMYISGFKKKILGAIKKPEEDRFGGLLGLIERGFFQMKILFSNHRSDRSFHVVKITAFEKIHRILSLI